MVGAGPGSLKSLLAKDGEDFVRSCYRAVLHRDADDAGLAHHLLALARGTSKSRIIVGLANSEEGVSKGVDRSPLAAAASERAAAEKLLPSFFNNVQPLVSLAARLHRPKAQSTDEKDREVEIHSHDPTPLPYNVTYKFGKTSATDASQEQDGASFWFDLTTAFQWTGGVVGIVRAELEMATGIHKIYPTVRYSMQVDRGFVEIDRQEIEWLLDADNVADAYMNFFARYKGAAEEPGVIQLEVPHKEGFFHPYQEDDTIFSVGWMDSHKENYFTTLKGSIPGVFLCYLVYDTILLGPDTKHFYNPIGSAQFERYLKWISHNCDFILYGGETAKKDTEAYQRKMGWPTPPGRAIKFGTDIVKLAESSDEASLLAELGVNGPFIMTVGSIEPRKNHETLYRAYLLAQELSAQPLPQLVICGKPMWRVDNLMDTLARDPRLEGRILCRTPTDMQLAALYKNCRFTLLPSLYEGWSLTLPESLGQGKFCLCADTPPLREIGGELVDFVDPFDAMAWAQKIIEYATNDHLLEQSEEKIAKQWPPMRWLDSARMAVEYIVEAAQQHASQLPRVEGLHDPAGWRPPTIWMDLTLSFLEWGGGVNGIVRAELMYAKLLKKLAPDTRFFAYEAGHFFEIDWSALVWLEGGGDLSQAYDWFHTFWNQHEAAGTGYRSALRSGGATPENPAYLKDFPPNSVLFFAGIDFGSYDEEGVPHLHRLQQIERHIRPGLCILRSQLIYDFTPLLLPHVHMPETVRGYLPFADFVSNNFDHIVYGGRTAQRDGIALQKARGWSSPPSDFVEFGSDINPAAKADISPNDKGDQEVLASLEVVSDFVMTIGTIEPRKNHEALYKAYLLMLKHGLLDQPLQMVFVGKKGWKSDDFLATLELDERVKGKILVLTPTDEQLDVLYRNCRFTLLPSFYEGWSLTLPESLSYGKFCLVSDVDPLRETGRDLVEYINPLDTRRWADRIAFYANNPDELAMRQAHIAAEWKATSWTQSAQSLLAALHRAHREAYEALLRSAPQNLKAGI